MTVPAEERKGRPLVIPRSVLPGRVRWSVRVLRGNATLAATIEEKLGRDGACRITANPRTGRVLVIYEAGIDIGDVLARVEAFAAEYRRSDYEHSHACGPHAHDHALGAEEMDREAAARRRSLAVGGGWLAFLGARRFAPALFLAAPVAGAVSAAVALVTGASFLRGAWNAIRAMRASTDVLVGTAIATSIVLGQAQTSVLVVWLLNIGEYLQIVVMRRSYSAIRNLLLASQDEEVWVVVGEGVEQRRLVSSLRAGDLIVVHSGHRIPADGMVVEGIGTVDEAPITGESMPVSRQVGAEVYAGTLVTSGRLVIHVTEVGSETVVGRLVTRIQEAQSARAPIQTIGDAFAARLVPVTFILAAAVFTVTGDVSRALAMLLIACPCAAGLATPTAMTAAIGNAARRGILIKGGRPLETLASADVLVLDKTGTLTTGSLRLVEIVPQGGFTERDVLTIAANAELHSDHPIGRAVIRAAEERGIDPGVHDHCEASAGRGVVATFGETVLLVGNDDLLRAHGVAVPPEVRADNEHYAGRAVTMMYVVRGGTLVGLIGMCDSVRPEAAEAIAAIRRLGVARVRLLTGDTEQAARSVATAVGIDDWSARQLPDHKHDEIERLRAAGYSVVMVGDGINDAPALASADVGIAMGTAGSDIAIETADVALASDDLRQVAVAIRLSEHSIRIVRQNYALSILVNGAGLLAGAMGALTPLMAAMLHNVSTVAVVINSARLAQYDPVPHPQLAVPESTRPPEP